MENYILAIDQSTSSTKAILFDLKGQLIQKVLRISNRIAIEGVKAMVESVAPRIISL